MSMPPRAGRSIADLAEKGCHTLALDVCDEASMSAAVDAVAQAEGAVGVLVNNAGYSQSGAVESVPIEQVRRQFETNVFGLIRMCQLVLPGMREQRWGKIVNIGSMGGRLTFPGGGLYHATKYAVEAISDALRFEVRGFGVDVIVVEPGLIVTKFGEVASRLGQRGRRRRAPMRVQSKVGEGDRGRLQGTDGQARRRPGGGGGHGSPRRCAEAAEGALPGHCERSSDDQSASVHARPGVGPDDARAVPHTGELDD